MFEWIGLSAEALWWIVVASVTAFVLALIAAPLLVIRIPADYFSHSSRLAGSHSLKHSWFRWLWLVLKNVLGFGFLFLGALMLVLPGQGILTILVGFTLLDFPGKFRLQRWIVTRRGVLESINWVRKKVGREPLALVP